MVMFSSPMSILRERTVVRMRALGLSQVATANRAGFGPPILNDLLRSRRNRIKPENILKLAKALDVQVAYLTGEDDEPTEPKADDLERAQAFFDRSTAYQKELERRLRQDRSQVPCPARLVQADVLTGDQRNEIDLAALVSPAEERKSEVIVFDIADNQRPAALVPLVPMRTTAAAPQQAGDPKAYAVVCPDAALSPRAERGEFLYAVRTVPRLSDLVVIRTVGSTPTLLIRQIIGVSGDAIQVRTFEAASEEWIRFDAVAALHAIRAIGSQNQ